MGILRVGKISFANCTPIFMALSEVGGETGIDLVGGVPTELNRMLDEGSVDISPSSSVAYLKEPGKLGFLPDLSISSIGPVESVILFSRVDLPALDREGVCLTPSSATSILLLRVLLERFAGIKPDYRAEEEGTAAKLLIGDAALSEAAKGEWPHVFDLGELWHRATGTPFVFALWLVRLDSFAKNPGGVRAFYRKLVAARQRAYRNYLRYSASAPEASWMGQERLLRYWGTISYDLTAWHMAGLRRFAGEAASMGLTAGVPDLLPLPVES